jgi:exonuclease III
LNGTNILNFKLVSAFNRKHRTHGGSCIYVRNNIPTKDIDYFPTLGEETNFGLSLTELIDHKLYIVCIYRAPDGQIDIFINKLEILIHKLLTKNKALLLCGDWNIDILHNNNNNQKDLLDLLQRYNLVNTVQSPTRMTKSTSSTIDLMIINRIMYKMPADIYELGLSDYSAQILQVMCRTPNCTPTKIWRRNFNKNNIKKFTNQ